MPTKVPFFALSLLIAFCFACGPQSVVQIPTLAVLPSLTPLPSDTFTPVPTVTQSLTYTPSHTPTPDALATQRAYLELTNTAGEATLAMLYTLRAPTSTSTLTFTPSLTITNTLMPSSTPNPVVPMQPALLYTRNTVNLRTCANRECSQVAQVDAGEGLMATGTIMGEQVNTGDPLWYRVDYQGRQVFVYGALVSTARPTSPPAQAVYAAPVIPCEATAVSSWLDSAYNAVYALMSLDPAQVQAGRNQFAGIAYPECAEAARNYLLLALDEMLLYSDASSRNDYDGALQHLDNASAYTDSFFASVTGLIGGASPIEEPAYSPPDYGGTSGGCPGLSLTCASLSCAEAYACLAAGNRSLDRDRDGIPCESVCG